MIHDLLDQVDKLRAARRAETEALAALMAMTLTDIRKDLGDAGYQFIDQRAHELIGKGSVTGTVSMHVLLAALRDAWKAGAVHEQKLRAEGLPTVHYDPPEGASGG